MEYVAVDEVVKGFGKAGEFPAKVRGKVLEWMAKRGTLRAKEGTGGGMVARDERLGRALASGIERFVYNTQGWSFAAVRAGIEEVAKAMEGRAGVSDYVRDVGVVKMGDGAGIQSREDRREVFVVEFAGTPGWTVLVETVHWIGSPDMVMVTLMAAELSKRLKTLAVGAWDDDFSGAVAIVCEDGERVASLNDEGDYVAFYGWFYENGVGVPRVFVDDSEGGETRLMVEDVGAVVRADRFVAAVPTEKQSNGPHVFYKLGMMAAAMEGEIEDEEAFMAALADGVWREVEGNLKT